ncbi:MAG TPA: SCO2522 family protein [Pseudonocardiaceae bacterium]|jgi:hypothetical protein|nr:SCO2522 family protein [Pseudonocardiaceae bacterium]
MAKPVSETEATVPTPSMAFQELADQSRVENVGLSHLSVELGHLYMEDFAAGQRRLEEQFERIAPWARAATAAEAQRHKGRARISTCFLIDDYFTQFSSPAEVLPQLLAAADKHGLTIDYLARESACAHTERTEPAELVAARLTAIPPAGTNGSRPPPLESGWLCNGERSPDTEHGQAMRAKTWSPPTEVGARNHSVFVDVELWHDRLDRRVYSCAFLAAVWQLLRLGLLRDKDSSIVRPVEPDGPFPREWGALPAITKLNPTAAPFCAYQTFSALPIRFLQVESAVRVILAQVAPQLTVLEQLNTRARAEHVALPGDISNRINYMFIGD